ncbi:YciE/YciF ferroxidase family protein [Candidatus Pantoea soli]|uniref:Ferritin-like domain-containing protein n=1 Tax=Candidatus Pantoea soli TaxID=3098669 RepID=A0A518XHY2_9GAMM|nr:DUF892 family protein [Pantoea soli]QDY43778.1 ferritin-like domain-containing protein [Pantoea soli]
MTRESVYLDWLRDAHAMEKHAETAFKAVLPRLAAWPVIESRFEHYLNATRQQQAQVREILKRYDASWSVLKEALGRMSAVGQAASDMLRDAAGVRVTVSSYVFCQYKVATYSTLLAAAELADDAAGMQVIQAALQHERDMCEWLQRQLPDAAEDEILHLTREEVVS